MKPKEETSALRFPEFHEKWDVKPLDQLMTKIGDGLHSTPVYDEMGEYFFINGNNLVDGRIVTTESTKKVNQTEYNKHKIDLDDKSILLSINGTIGSLGLYNKERVVLGKSACYLNVSSAADRIFIFNLLQTTGVKNHFVSELTGSTIKNLSLSTIRNCRVHIPMLPEQQKIAVFLSAVDEKIGQLARKKKLLLKYKKGVMQRIFNQKIRFKEDNNNEFPDWKECSLGGVGEIVGGGTPETDKKEYWGGNIPWFTPTEIKSKFIDKSCRTLTEKGLRNSSARLLPKGTLLLSSRATVGDVGIALNQCSTNQGFQSIIVNADNVNEFVYYWLTNNRKELLRKSNGSTFLEISKSEISKIPIVLPSKPEQSKIAEFLSTIDEKIELVNRQIEGMKGFKEGLLQQMFV